MASLWKSLHTLGQAVYSHSVKLVQPSAYTCQTLTLSRHASDDASDRNTPAYDSYPKFETPTPFRNQFMRRHGYEYKYHTGGLLPRSKEYVHEPLPRPKYAAEYAFTTKKALAGQNDYIDILGDGTIHPWELIQGPLYLKGYRGSEMKRLVRRMAFQGDYLKENFPVEYHKVRKRIYFLYKRLNHKRHHGNFWSRKGNFRFSRHNYKY